MRSSFINPLERRSSRAAGYARTVKQWTREALSLGNDTVVSINEVTCSLPDCPSEETVILVMKANGDILQVSLREAIQDVTREDVSALWADFLKEQTHPRRGGG